LRSERLLRETYDDVVSECYVGISAVVAPHAEREPVPDANHCLEDEERMRTAVTEPLTVSRYASVLLVCAGAILVTVGFHFRSTAAGIVLFVAGVMLLYCGTTILVAPSLLAMSVATAVCLLSFATMWQPSPVDVAALLVLPLAFYILKTPLRLPFVLALLFFLWTAVSLLWSVDPHNSIYHLFALGADALIFTAVFIGASSAKEWRRAFDVLVFACLVTAVIVIIQTTLAFTVLPPPRGVYVWAPAGLTQHHSLAALMAGFAGFFFLAKTIQHPKAASILASLVCFLAVPLSFSRGPLVSIMVVLPFFLVWSILLFHRRIASVSVLAALALFITSTLLALPLVSERFAYLVSERFYPYRSYDINRLTVGRVSLVLATEHPFGVGLGNIPIAAVSLAEQDPNIPLVPPDKYALRASSFRMAGLRRHRQVANLHEENAYLKIASELGFPGLAVFVLLIVASLWRFVSLLRCFPTYATAGFFGLLIFLTDLMFCGGLYWRHLWILLGFSAAAPCLLKTPSAEEKS